MKAVSAATSVARHSAGVVAEGFLIAAIVAALLLALAPVSAPASQLAGTGTAAAARGVITVPDGVFAGTTTATVNPGGGEAWAYAHCYQGGKRVYVEYVKVDDGNRATFTLGPTELWSTGSAACVGEEGYWKSGRWHKVAATTFHVSG